MKSKSRFRPSGWDALEDRVVMSRGLKLGALGDSFTDEYQFYAPDRTRARNWVEILASTERARFGRLQKVTRGEPRNQGYLFNWARSESDTANLLNQQLPGLLKQVNTGKVRDVSILSGGNDFLGLLRQLTLGQVSPVDAPAALAAVEARAEENLSNAVNQLLAANPRVRLVLGTIFDIRLVPIVQAGLADPRFQAVGEPLGQAVAKLNAHIRSIGDANPNRIALADFETLGSRIGTLPAVVPFGGTQINIRQPSNDFHSLFLADGLHLGTVGQGLIANTILGALRQRFGVEVPTLSERQIVRFATALQRRLPPMTASNAP